jgi:uracil-DNA glycosylase
MDKKYQQYYLNQMGLQIWDRRSKDSNKQDGITIEDKALHGNSDLSIHDNTHAVIIRGSVEARLMVIVDGLLVSDEQENKYFTGKEGLLLEKMLASIGLAGKDAYIANIIKHQLPSSQDATTDEYIACRSYLIEQIKLVKPDIILGVGSFSAKLLLENDQSLSTIRQTLYRHEGKPIVFTHHPTYLLQHPTDKKQAFNDLTQVKQFLSDAI